MGSGTLALCGYRLIIVCRWAIPPPAGKASGGLDGCEPCTISRRMVKVVPGSTRWPLEILRKISLQNSVFCLNVFNFSILSFLSSGKFFVRALLIPYQIPLKYTPGLFAE